MPLFHWKWSQTKWYLKLDIQDSRIKKSQDLHIQFDLKHLLIRYRQIIQCFDFPYPIDVKQSSYEIKSIGGLNIRIRKQNKQPWSRCCNPLVNIQAGEDYEMIRQTTHPNNFEMKVLNQQIKKHLTEKAMWKSGNNTIYKLFTAQNFYQYHLYTFDHPQTRIHDTILHELSVNIDVIKTGKYVGVHRTEAKIPFSKCYASGSGWRQWLMKNDIQKDRIEKTILGKYRFQETLTQQAIIYR